jgi:hypothetical protein
MINLYKKHCTCILILCLICANADTCKYDKGGIKYNMQDLNNGAYKYFSAKTNQFLIRDKKIPLNTEQFDGYLLHSFCRNLVDQNACNFDEYKTIANIHTTDG